MNDDQNRSKLARDLLARDRRYVWHPFTQHGTEGDPIVLTGAKGASLFDADGNKILDLVSSWWTCTHGHSHPKLNAALAEQAARFEHVMFAGFTHEPAVNLATGLAELLPGDLSRVFFSDDGSTSVEVALKIAYQYWINVGEPRRQILVGFDGGYHGDTLGAMSLGRGSQMFSPFRDLMCKVVVLPYPATFEGDDAADEREAGAISAFEALIADRGQSVAGLIIEPLLQGAGGMRLCRPSFLKRLVEAARASGVLVIFDEVATGFGRTGTMFAMEQASVVPDLVCLSKGLTSGYMPLAVTVAPESIFEAFLGESFERALPHGHSFTANPLACAVALASLDLFKEEKTLERIARINKRHKAALAELAARPDVTRPRLIGSILAFDVKTAGGYQSAESRALRDWYLAARSDDLSYAAILHHRRRAFSRLRRLGRRTRCTRLRRAEPPIDDVPSDAAAELCIGGVDGAAKRAWRQRRVTFLRRKPADCLHALEESKRTFIGEKTLFLDDAWKLVDLGKPARKPQFRKHLAPFGKALEAECGVEQDTTRSEQLLKTLQACNRIGKPMQRHA
jgi:adenosylmethionine---8-amino-7-oxononanoate aminotransferase